MGVMASQITSLMIVYSTVYSGPDQSKHQSSASLDFVWGTGEFPAQMASNAENVSIWWRHHVMTACQSRDPLQSKDCLSRYKEYKYMMVIRLLWPFLFINMDQL